MSPASLNPLPPLLEGCSPEQIRELSKFVEAVSVRAHQEIYHEGEPAHAVHLLKKGEVALEKERGEGCEPMRLSIVRSGECFGLGEFMLPAYYTTATALTDCELLRINAADFRARFLSLESIRSRVILELSHIAKYLLFSVVSGSGTQMLALYLHKLCLADARLQDGKYHIRTKLKQPEIASLLNLSREHVTRLFARLQEQGVVQFNQGSPVVDKKWLESTVTDMDLADFIVYRDYPQ